MSAVVSMFFLLSMNSTDIFSGLNGDPVVWTEPAFPTQTDSVTVLFDATRGNGELAGFSGTVYGHIGVITTKSTHPIDWKNVIGNWGTADSRTRMTKVEEDLYSIRYHIPTFHNLSPTDTVLKLAFVFRNESGNIVGRDSDGSDIFVDVYPSGQSLFINLRSPIDGTIIQQGDSVLIDIQLSQKALLSITDNDQSIFEDSIESASYYHFPEDAGYHDLVFNASSKDTSVTANAGYFVIDSSLNIQDPPNHILDGINYFSDSTYIFKLTAPGKAFAFFLCPSNDFEINDRFLMNKSPEGDVFWIELEKSLFISGDNIYQYLVEPNIRIADPFSHLVLDPNHDPFIEPSYFASLPAYPSNKTEGIISVFQAEESEFPWREIAFQRPENQDLIVYEVMMRDFLDDHSYSSLLDTLNYLEKLGVNAIELMPIHEFEGNISWGYNPSFHMAVDKYYGSPNQLKRVIDEAHVRGIAVILDVVFNHAFSQSPLVQMYWDGTRPSSDNPWLNVTARHPFNVGFDFNHESPYTRNWVKQQLTYWIKEFRFDGFRFDLSKGLTQTNSGNNAGLMSRYDPGRIAILKDYADHIWAHDPAVYVIMEHFADNDEETELADYGMMLWGNMNHAFTEAAAGRKSDLGWADYNMRGWSKPHLISYMESHDEERIMYNILRNGESDGNYNVRQFNTALTRIEAISSIYFLLPGPKMIWQFGELGYEFSINQCVNGTVDGCRLDPKPIRWDFLQDSARNHLRQTISALLHLRKEYPVFSSDNYDFHDGNLFIKSITFSTDEMDALVIANFRVVDSNVIPGFSKTGTWYEYFSRDSINVLDLEARLELTPGEYRIYTTTPIDLPEDYVTSSTDFAPSIVSIFPNPAKRGDQLVVLSHDLNNVKKAELISIDGKRMPVHSTSFSENAGKIRLPQNVPPGIYTLQLYRSKEVLLSRLVVE